MPRKKNDAASPEKGGFLRRAPSQERGHERVAEILAACRSLLNEVPFYKVTIAMIAARAGMQPGTVYFFFPDKTSIFCSLIEAVLHEIADTQRSAAEDARSLEELVVTLEERLAKIWEDNECLLDLYFSYRSLAPMKAFEQQVNGEAYTAIQSNLARFLPTFEENRLSVLTRLIVTHIGGGLDVAAKFRGEQHLAIRQEWQSMLLAYTAAAAAEDRGGH